MSGKTFHRQGMLIVIVIVILSACLLIVRLSYLMIGKADHYGQMAKELHERERAIKAKRGCFYDRNGTVLAGNVSVSTISVIHSQLEDPERVIKILTEELGLGEDYIRKRVEKVSSREKIKSNVPKEISDRIRQYDLAGVMVDEDYKRYYPYDELASHVIGFTGADNQGIIGLEVTYDRYLSGTDGAILTLTNAKGIEINNAAENRREPVNGNSLLLSLDINIQQYADMAAKRIMEEKSAASAAIIIMNPSNGEIYAMVSLPEFNLNDPFSIPGRTDVKMDELNALWRNPCISNTYEPGSTFKIITAASALEAGAVKTDDTFSCPGFIVVEDRRIRCHKKGGHGAQDFRHGIMNSCNPVFVSVGQRLGTDRFFEYMTKLGIFDKTGVDLPGEAKTIMHKKENVGAVELATISFGQSFQLTPLRLMASVSSVINGGKTITPHFGVGVIDNNNRLTRLDHESIEGVVSSGTSETMRSLLESVVSEGTGKNAGVEGFRIGGKTGTSEKLPRHSGKYIASCLGFAPADDPKVMALVLIDEPQGTYYGGTIAAPVIADLFGNILPYLGIQ